MADIEKVTRVAFLYLEPKPRDDKDSFAQCESCRMFVPEVEGLDGSRCIIHGSKEEIDSDDSCGFYVDWPKGKPNPEVVEDHARELALNIPGSVTPKESGLVDDRVQCRRCEFSEKKATVCGLYRMLNGISAVDFDDAIEPNACCNAWTKKSSGKSVFTKARAEKRYANG